MASVRVTGRRCDSASFTILSEATIRSGCLQFATGMQGRACAVEVQTQVGWSDVEVWHSGRGRQRPAMAYVLEDVKKLAPPGSTTSPAAQGFI
eukprot:365130-Chlamydomonas_euryale.AAC.34